MHRLILGLALTVLVACTPAAPAAAPAKPTAAPAAQPTSAPAAQPTTAAAKPAEKAPAAAQPAAKAIPPDYYRGKTLRIVASIEPGGTGDLQARFFAEQLPKFIPGNPNIVVSNMPGGSGFTAANFMWTAAPDGLTMQWGNGATPQQQLEEFSSAKFKYDEFVRVYSLEGQADMMFILGDAPYKRIQDAIGGSTEFTYGLLSEKDATEINFLKEALRLPVKVVFGIETGTAKFLLAMDRKDVQSMSSGSGWYQITKQRPGWLKDGYLQPFAIQADPKTKLAKNDEIDVPADLKNVREFMTPEQVKMYDVLRSDSGPFYRNGYLPPNTPTEIRDILSDAFTRALQDKAFMEGWVKLTGREPDKVLTGAELDKLAKSISLQDLDSVFKRYLPGYTSPL